jgi:hypothetical protein
MARATAKPKPSAIRPRAIAVTQVCAWCGAARTVTNRRAAESLVSHGLCKACARRRARAPHGAVRLD